MNRLKVSGFIYGLLLVGFLPGCKKDFFVNENTIAITRKPTAYKLNLPKISIDKLDQICEDQLRTCLVEYSRDQSWEKNLDQSFQF